MRARLRRRPRDAAGACDHCSSGRLDLLTVGTRPAFASHVYCGDTITTDTTLDTDLIDCPSNGIVIGADDITLDLNGHVIDGDGTEFAGCGNREFCDVGVLDIDHDGVTVRDGSAHGLPTASSSAAPATAAC